MLDPKGAQALEIDLVDEVSGVEIHLVFGVFEEHNAITQSVRIVNGGDDEVMVEKACSASVDLPSSDFDMLHLAGAWSREFHMVRRHLVQGSQSVGSARRGRSRPEPLRGAAGARRRRARRRGVCHEPRLQR